MVKEKEKLAYINPEKSQEEKAKGNEKFKQGIYKAWLLHELSLVLQHA